jgi:hypothetical protein
MNDEIYVIYYNGMRYDSAGRKIAYLKKGSARGVVTVDAEEFARLNYGRGWYDLPREERDRLVAEEKSKFSVKVYVPKEDSE